jgi:maltooligosyltrehalose trehalohydrolase
VLVVAEDHRNLGHMLQPVHEGGLGLDGVWADDFHHQVRVHTAGDREGYFEDYDGTADDLATTMRQGWFYTGQRSAHLGVPRGTSAEGVSPAQLVICIQNHDQIGNRADGARLHHQVDAATYRAVTTLLLLAPQTPLLFMGQEWAARTPFQFFTDHHGELGRLVTEGRRREFAAFAAFADPASRERIPDPQALGTFARSRLEWSELAQDPHARTLQLYRRLLAFRRSCPPLQHTSRLAYQVRALDAHTVALSLPYPPASPHPRDRAGRQTGLVASGHGDRWLHLVVRLSGAGVSRLPIGAPPVSIVLTTEDAEFVAGGETRPITCACGSVPGAPDEHVSGGDAACDVRFDRPGAVVLVERD